MKRCLLLINLGSSRCSYAASGTLRCQHGLWKKNWLKTVHAYAFCCSNSLRNLAENTIHKHKIRSTSCSVLWNHYKKNGFKTNIQNKWETKKAKLNQRANNPVSICGNEPNYSLLKKYSWPMHACKTANIFSIRDCKSKLFWEPVMVSFAYNPRTY